MIPGRFGAEVAVCAKIASSSPHATKQMEALTELFTLPLLLSINTVYASPDGGNAFGATDVFRLITRT